MRPSIDTQCLNIKYQMAFSFGAMCILPGSFIYQNKNKIGYKHIREAVKFIDFWPKMSSMFIKCTSRDNKPRNEPANTNAGRPMEGISKNFANVLSNVPVGGTVSFQVTAYKRASEETLVTDTSDVEASTSTALSCRNISSNSLLDRRQPLVSKADNSVSRSSCKRKSALPKKRPSTIQEPMIISAETGEAVDDDAALTEDSVCSSGNDIVGKDCRFGIGGTDLQRLLSVTEKCVLPNLCGATNARNILYCDNEFLNGEIKSEHWETSSISSSDILMIDTRSNSLSLLEDVDGKQQTMECVESSIITDIIDYVDSTEYNTDSSKAFHEPVDIQITENSPSQTDSSVDRTNKYQEATDTKICNFSEQFVGQRNGSIISNLNDVLILNAAINSFLWANAATGTDGANPFITPEMLASLSAADLSSSLAVPCASNLTDSLISVDQQQSANMLLLEAVAAARGAGTMRDLLGITSTNDAAAIDVMSGHKSKLSAVSSMSATAEIVPTSAPNIFFNDDHDGMSKKHDQRLGDHFSHNGRAASAGKNVNVLGDTKRQSNKCKISDIKLSIKKRANEEILSSAARAITKEEKIDLDELENFAQTFKKQRIKFGFTQGDVGLALGRRYGTDFSQTTISRFEALNLSFKNMCKLRPLLKEWLEDAEAALANGATISDLLDAPSREPTLQYHTSVIHLPLNNNKPSSLMSINASSGNKMLSDESPSPNGSTVCSSGTAGGVPLKKRRKRTNLDLAQRSALDAYFDMNPRPDHNRMAEIAELVGLDRDVVRVWFCNRRQKLRKE
uniref:POU domain protein n=3 Tax=Brugia malayi TaxID=6279 RepID=A0A1U7F1F5_BRUMA|nr:Bm7341, isoform f [Brugia malayi]